MSIGFAVVAIVVVLVAMILTYAARIVEQAKEGISLMDEARENTNPVWRIQEINASSTTIWRTAEKARGLLEGDDAHAHNPR